MLNNVFNHSDKNTIAVITGKLDLQKNTENGCKTYQG